MRDVARFRKHQVALCLCVGMTVRQMAAALGISKERVYGLRSAVLDEAGMDPFEFALQQNAAVREKLWGKPGDPMPYEEAA